MSILLNASPFRDKFRSNVRRHLTSISDHSFSLAIANHREPVFTLLSVFLEKISSGMWVRSICKKKYETCIHCGENCSCPKKNPLNLMITRMTNDSLFWSLFTQTRPHPKIILWNNDQRSQVMYHLENDMRKSSFSKVAFVTKLTWIAPTVGITSSKSNNKSFIQLKRNVVAALISTK